LTVTKLANNGHLVAEGTPAEVAQAGSHFASLPCARRRRLCLRNDDAGRRYNDLSYFEDAVTTPDDFPATLWENPFTLHISWGGETCFLRQRHPNATSGSRVDEPPLSGNGGRIRHRRGVRRVRRDVIYNWNGRDGVTFKPYRELEILGTQQRPTTHW